MNLTKNARCHIRMQSRWASASAICMGISVFIRTVYYFGLINLRDLTGFELAMDVIFPMAIAAGYMVMIKGLQLNSPTLFGGLICLYAVNYLLLMNTNVVDVICGLLMVASAAVFIVTGLGFIPIRTPVVAVSAVLVLFRIIAVDLNGYILPVSQFHPVTYLPEASNLFGILAVSLMAPALQLTRLHNPVAVESEQTPEAPEVHPSEESSSNAE